MMANQDAASNSTSTYDAPYSQAVASSMPDAEYQVDDQPAFIVGVTGNMDPTEPDVVKDRVRCLFRFLRRGTQEHSYEESVADLELHLVPLTKTVNADDHAGHHHDKPHADPATVYRDFFQDWPGLGGDPNEPNKRIPIVVLSSLAPGADQLVAEVALEPEFQQAGFHLRCPLPFPMDLYRQASTFVRQEDADKERLRQLRSIIATDNDQRCFTVAMKEDMSQSKDELSQQHKLDVPDQKRRRLRYQAAGEYIAAYSHLMIAIWDHQYDADTTAGTAIAHVGT